MTTDELHDLVADFIETHGRTPSSITLTLEDYAAMRREYLAMCSNVPLDWAQWRTPGLRFCGIPVAPGDAFAIE